MENRKVWKGVAVNMHRAEYQLWLGNTFKKNKQNIQQIWDTNSYLLESTNEEFRDFRCCTEGQCLPNMHIQRETRAFIGRQTNNISTEENDCKSIKAWLGNGVKSRFSRLNWNCCSALIAAIIAPSRPQFFPHLSHRMEWWENMIKNVDKTINVD